MEFEGEECIAMSYGKIRAALLCAGITLMMATCVNAASEEPGEPEVTVESTGNEGTEYGQTEKTTEPEEEKSAGEVTPEGFQPGELPVTPEEETGNGSDSGSKVTEIPGAAADTENILPTDDDLNQADQSTAGVWAQDGQGGWKYSVDGAELTGLQSVNGKTYFFNDAGILQTGFQTIEGVRYYFNPNGQEPSLGLGAMMTSVWINEGGADYYLGDDGVPLIGQALIGSKRYCFDADGRLLTGWQTIGDNTYYLQTDGSAGEKGRMYTGWQTMNNKVYYFQMGNTDGNIGAMYTGRKMMNGKVYYFHPDGDFGERGRMYTGWQTIGSNIHYFQMGGDLGEKGQMYTGWRTMNNKVYYFQKGNNDGNIGKMYTGRKMMNGKVYYFQMGGDLGERGHMYTGWRTIGDNINYFQMGGNVGEKGQMYTGWRTMNNKVYYFQKGNSDGNIGKMYTGLRTMNGKRYYFQIGGKVGEKGQMYTGWRTIGKNVNYFQMGGKAGEKGQMYTGWKTMNSKVYYFQVGNADGNVGALYTGWHTMNGKSYYFQINGVKGEKGQMYTGWKTLNKERYWFKETGAHGVRGASLTGWQRYKNEWYYLQPKEKGAMATGWTYVPINNSSYRDTSISSYKYYFRPDSSGGPKGSLMQDVSGLIGRQEGRDGYRAEIDRTHCVVTIYAKDETGKYRIPVKAMTCSVGLPDTPTPRSSYQYPFRTIEKLRWGELMGPSYGQYCTRIVAGILFHSVAGSNTTSYNLSAGNYNMLGSPASHGCVRLCVRDAKWIYDNCDLGMQVVIRDNMYLPFDKPATIKIPAGQTWDPTDPNI